ncbi:hypothetical protein GCM10020001_039320 [Nonomuraea salmonea]|jgi:hypothetical protein
MLTDAEWAPLAEGGRHGRKAVYGCELRPGHAGAHAAHIQLLRGPDRFIRPLSESLAGDGGWRAVRGRAR